jgi:peptide/nickel transport system ATP-binding protein
MYAGQIVETGTVVEIFSNPQHPYTQGLLECIPIPGKTRPGAHLGSIPGIVPTLIGELSGCTFRHRCGYAHAACTAALSDRREIGPGRGYWCVLPPAQAKRKRTRHFDAESDEARATQ